ncbi:MAG TPA: hypothetical protein VHP83_06850, partial [Aggregatilineaceae bacterium]|nr:hypothetical protein [Aggregatilineaceae bacterium]
MLIREPLVHATYFYLRETPGSNPTRRQEWHDLFVTDTQRILQSVAGWLALPAPTLPAIPMWDAQPPLIPQTLMQTGELQGRTNASAWFTAYALRNMLLLRVVVSRPGEHEQAVWSMLDEASGIQSNAESWLHTTRYWCGMAPRTPDELNHEHSQPIKAPFGVLCLGWNASPHLLVYPDAKTEARAVLFLRSLASQLDWYPVQAQYLLGQYETRSFIATRNQQTALEHVAQSVQEWGAPTRRNRLRSLSPLQGELDTLERTYGDILTDRTSTEAASHEVRALMAEYRLALLQNGLWDSAPTAWEAQIAG